MLILFFLPFPGSLWVSVVLNPQCDNSDRRRYVQVLESWSKLEICPLEDPDHRHHHSSSSSLSSSSRRNSLVANAEHDATNNFGDNEFDTRPILGPFLTKKKPRRPRSIFHKAIDALKMDWNDSTLNQILHNKYNDWILWTEHLPTACARIDALKTHGFDDEALRLAIGKKLNDILNKHLFF